MVNIRFPRGLILILALLVAPVTGGAQDRPTLTLFAAASLAQALEAAVDGWPGDVRISTGGSGGIARQIAQGAPADVVMLANPVWMDWLEAGGHIRAAGRSAPVGNRLVLVGPAGAPPLASADLPGLLARLGPSGRIAMGDHRAVPAGQYAQQWMARQGLWHGLRDRLAETDNVRAALTLVTRGEVPLAFIYASDLAAQPAAATQVWAIPPAEQPDIRYALAPVTPAGDDLAAYLAGDTARAVFLRFGFREVTP